LANYVILLLKGGMAEFYVDSVCIGQSSGSEALWSYGLTPAEMVHPQRRRR
jgi:hypothetical protein